VTNLRAKSSGASKVYDYVWYDISDSVTVDDADLSRNQRYLVANNSGLLSLSHVAGSNDSDYTLPAAVDIVNGLFTDQEGDNYYTSYETNYRKYTHTAAVNDLSMSAVLLNGDEDHMTLDVNSLTNNKLTLHLSDFDNDSGRNLSENFQVFMDTELDFFPEASVTDISNFMTLNLRYFGVDAVAGGSKNYTLGVNGTLDLSVNALTSNAVLKFESDADANDVEFNAYPKPSILMADMLPESVSLGAGRTGVSVPVTVPVTGIGLKSGAWNWNMYIEDGDYTSSRVPIKLVIAPSLTAPTVDKPSLGFVHDVSGNQTINIKYFPADVTNADISAWNPLMDVSASILSNDTNKTVRVTPTSAAYNGLSLVQNWNNMGVRNLDASANFTLKYDEKRYELTETSYILRVTWNDTKGGVDRYIDSPFTITGVTHNDKVTVTNNYNGTYTLTGGNKRASLDAYVTRIGSSGSWSRLTSATFTETSPNINREFAVTDVLAGNVAPDKVFARSVQSFTTTNALLSIDISSGPMFGPPVSASVIPITGEGEAGSSSIDETTRLNVGSDGKTDIFVNISKPSWFNDLPNANMTVKIVENIPDYAVGNLLGFDLSSNLTDVSAVALPSGGFQATTDASAYEFGSDTDSFAPSINLIFKPERLYQTDLIVTATFKGKSPASTMSEKVARFTVSSTIINNPGNHLNNLIVPNRTKLNLTKNNASFAPVRLTREEKDVSEAFNGVVDVSTNSYRILGTAENGMAYVDLVSTTLTNAAIKHVFDISGFDLQVTNGNGYKPRVYFPYSKYATSVTPGSYSDVSGFYSSNYDDIFIDFGYFTGILDITYSTYYASEYSAAVNTLRVYVIPRPGLAYDAVDPSDNITRVNAPTWLRHTITNIQKNGNSNIGWNNDGTDAALGHEGISMSSLLDTYASIYRTGVPTFVDLSNNVPDGDHFEVDVSVNTVSYGVTNAEGGLIKFKGVDIDNEDVSTNPHTLWFESTVYYKNHIRLGASALSASDNFKIHVIDDDERVYASEIVASDIFMSGTLSLNNIEFVKYYAATGDVDLTTNSYKNTLHIIIENTHSAPIDVTYGVSTTQSLNFAQRGYFRRDTTNNWSYIGVVGVGGTT
jgi:hypothetical protein